MSTVIRDFVPGVRGWASSRRVRPGGLRLDQRRGGRGSVGSSRVPGRGCRIRGAAFDDTVPAGTRPWEDDMKYIALLCGEPDAGRRRGRRSSWRCSASPVRDGGMATPDPGRQQPAAAAADRDHRPGPRRETQLSDGPFAEIKEQLGGYYILDCEDLDTALRYAAMIPSAKYGSVEVRPVMVMGPPERGHRAGPARRVVARGGGGGPARGRPVAGRGLRAGGVRGGRGAVAARWPAGQSRWLGRGGRSAPRAGPPAAVRTPVPGRNAKQCRNGPRPARTTVQSPATTSWRCCSRAATRRWTRQRG